MNEPKKNRRMRINQKIVGKLRDALSSAKRERCGVDAEAQEAMRLYLDSWVVAPLASALRLIEGRGEWSDHNDELP